MIRILLILLLFIPLCCGQVLAEQEEVNVASIVYPGISEVVPRASALSERINGDIELLGKLSETVDLVNVLRQEQQRYDVLKQRITDYGEMDSWYFDRQLEINSQLKVLGASMTRLVQRISRQLEDVDQIYRYWQERKGYWLNWNKDLHKNDVSLPLDIFSQVQQQISSVQKIAEKNNQPLVTLQKEVTALQESIQFQRGQLEAALKALRKNLLRHNGYSMLSPTYWQQFSPDLLQAARQEAFVSLQIRKEYYQQNALLISLQFMCGLVVALIIYRYQTVIAQSTRWNIIAQHTIATSVFAAIILFSFFYNGIPPLFRLALASLGLFAAVRLFIGFLTIRSINHYLYGFSILTLMTLALRVSGFPLPFYRAFLAAVSVVLMVLLVRLCRLIMLAGSNKYLMFFRGMGLLLFFSFLANIAGFVALSFRLLESSLESVVVILFAVLAYQIGIGGLALALSRLPFERLQTVQNFSRDLQRRIENIFLVFLVGYSCLHLTVVWGLYSSVGRAWSGLTEYAWTIGNYHLQLTTILQVGFVFYLSLELSWLLQALLDRQLFNRRSYDRGVRDAVKKLLHYTIVLVGLLFAASVAGFELQNIMVLAGAFGIGIGFGLQDIVNNFLSGIIILFERPIKVGDGVLIDGEYGTVLRIGLRSTVVENLDQAELIVPNSQLISQKLTNWTLSTRRVRVVLPVGVAYGSDLPLVLQILADAAQHPDVLSHPEPSPIFIQFGASSLDFELRVWISDIDKRPRVKSELLLFIDQQFRDAGVEIPFPQRDLHLRSISDDIASAYKSRQSNNESTDPIE